MNEEEKKAFFPCGAYCERCGLYKTKCAGCIETNGKPFYIEKGKSCPVLKCATEHKVEHCGECEEFPCNEFLDWYDPKRGIVTALRRAGLLVLRKKIGTEAWIKWLEDNDIKLGV